LGNKTDCHDIIGILLKVALNTITHSEMNNNMIHRSRLVPVEYTENQIVVFDPSFAKNIYIYVINLQNSRLFEKIPDAS
jgi:hypothetical protein